ncbi:periphilin-1-like isoform X2 [Girardinichthys multiradiatus]|uniref:periphilin-1-like isoform X2 n=1 Tax=Girardinichthys multiradiatus TaxID=208333 RepID=UPI001FAC4B3A|nr:periphilin-1-like isoform X2 [Girardinichthys multiradiatus]
MAYQHGRKSIRQAYEERFAPKDAREVTVHRVVNIIEKRSPIPRPGMDVDRGYDDQRYGGPRNYQSGRGYHSEDSYLPDDNQYYDENPNYGSYRRNSPPHRNDGPYPQQSYGRDDLRNRSRGHNLRKRGRGHGPPPREDYDDYRSSKSLVITRDRSPGRREGYPPVRSGSNSNRSFSPEMDKGYTYQQKHKSNTTKSYTPSRSVEGSPHRPVPSKEQPSASAAETEEAVAASTEPKLTPEEDLKARRSEAIKAKVAEIEKHYRQDCETFRTVVKMLVEKEPSLDGLLQAPLDKNLLEIRQHCLDAIKSFVMELDEILEQPNTTA